MDSIFDSGPADTIPLPVEPGRRAKARVAVKDAAKVTRHVADAARDGLIFEALSHGCAALVGVGLWPLVEHAGHAVLGWVVG
jgi:hypothetical protein